MTQLAGSLDVRHRDGLTAYGVVRHRQYHERHVAFVLLEHAFQLLQRHVSFERRFQLRVLRLVARHIDSKSFAGLDMPFRGVEMRITGYHLTRFDQVRKQHVLCRTTLVRRDHVLKTRQCRHHVLKLKERTGTRVTLVARHHRSPLTVRHRTRSRIGQQVDIHLFGT